MIACIWPESGNEDQTLATLRFASRMSCIKNEPIVNSQTDKSQTCQRLEAEVLVLATVCSVLMMVCCKVALLKQELALHNAMANRAPTAYEPVRD